MRSGRAGFACLLSIALAVSFFAPAVASTHASPGSAKPLVLRADVPRLVKAGGAVRLAQYPKSTTISIVVALKLRNAARLNEILGSINDPDSLQYHHFLTQGQANRIFNPTLAQQMTVERWLTANGFSVTYTYPNHLLIDARGSVQSVNRTFRVSLFSYRAPVNKHSVTFYAPSTAPVISSSVSSVVSGVIGLDSVPRFQVASNGSTDNSPPYYPQDYVDAYDINPLWKAGDDGSKQHIGITMWTVPPTDATLQHFGSVTGANVATTANGRLKIIKVDGGDTMTDAGEAGMDIEYSSGMAPAATIDYYEAPTAEGEPTDQGLLDALNQAGTDSNDNEEITNSWGGCEASSAADSFTAAAESVFASNSTTGHNYFFASGDTGSECGGADPYPSYPPSSPNVVSVGGTTFSGDIDGDYPGESAWVYCSRCAGREPEGSGGGYSNIFTRPPWQVASGLANNGFRGYPDVSTDADPNTGAEVCYGAGSACDQFGGTSLASPLWAGMFADVNQYLAAQGKAKVGFLDPILYSIAKVSEPFKAFHDVTSETNGAYDAGTGWDPVTGLGSPDIWNLARDMAGLTSTPPKITLTVVAASETAAYGSKMPTLRWTANFSDGTTAQSLTKQPICKTTAETASGKIASPAGKYPITCSGAAGSIFIIAYRGRR